MIFNYDLKSQKFEISEDAISSRMLTTKEHAFESFDVSTTSEDGMRIVLRITKLKDVQLNGNNPVYMHVYGGFGRLAGFYPEYRAVVAEFLARGGIVVDPTLRGGNEFGDSWHEEAKGKKKINTFNDLIAASRYLVDHGYTQARKIIIVGGSNGGLTVTGAALKSPQSFGLVISVNGVHDLLGKETLDPAFGAGWSYEYGDSREPEEFERLSELSPVERARNAKDLPQFLILNGRQDSRVHPAHSFKLYKALSESNPQAVRMVSLNNAGHWATDVDTQDLIAWRANVIIWTSIFDYLGWRK
jgi:prolyl oligopeptidase